MAEGTDSAPTGNQDLEIAAGDVSAALLSSDGEHLPARVGGGSSEFERLMEDSIESDAPGPGANPHFAFSAPTGAIMRSPRSSPASAALNSSPLQGSPVPWARDGEAPAAAPAPPSLQAPASGPPATRGFGSADAGPAWPQQGAEDVWASRQLSCRMDQIAREMKVSVEHEFVLAERAIMAQQRAALEAQRLKAEAAAYQQQSVMDALKEEKAQLSNRLDQKQRQLKESLILLQRARNGVVGRCIQERALCAWRGAARAIKDSRIKSRLAIKLREHQFENVAFGLWRRHSQASRSSKLVAHERAAAEMARAKLVEQLEVENTRSACEVERLSRLLAEEAQQRSLLQENLKRVFMRGVCALNFEAMTLLADGSMAEPGSAASGAPLAPNPVLPAAPPLDWAQFQASTAASSGARAPTPPPAPECHTVTAGAAAVGGTEVAVSAQPGEPVEVIQVTANSPRQPPVPAAPPIQVGGPLPFVNWNNPIDAAPAATPSKAPLPRPGVKNQRWQAASAPRGPAPRSEMIAVG